MQRKIWNILAFLFLSSALVCCSNQVGDSIQNNHQTIEEETVPQADTIAQTGQIELAQVTDVTQSNDVIQTTEMTAITESVDPSEPVNGVETEKVYYAVHKLSKQEKLVYEEILDLLRNQTAEGKISTKSTDTLKKVFQCVMDDHPELFYVNGYQYSVFSLAGNVTRILIQPSYIMDSQQIETAQKKIDKYEAECMKKLKEKESDYAKVRYLYEYVILNTEYKNNAENSQNICSVFINHESVCQGYAKSLQYLCQKAGIQTGLVNGTLKGVGHAWNVVKLDGAWYYVDATLGDASYVSSNEETQVDYVPPISYEYLCVTTDTILKTHKIDNTVAMPDCKSIACNYYVQEDLFFKSYDEEQARKIFSTAAQEKQKYVSIQCADQESFDEVKTQLIDQQKVFSFIGNHQSSIGYAQNDVLYTLSFWTL